MSARIQLVVNVCLFLSAVVGTLVLAGYGYDHWQVSSINTLEEVPSRTLGTAEVSSLPVKGKASLLLVFSPRCGVCEKTAPAWRTLLQRPEMQPYNVLGISFSVDDDVAVTNFLSAQNLPLTTTVVDHEHFRRAVPIEMVPAIIVTGKSGKLTYLREGGILTPAGADSVMTYLSAAESQ